MDPIEGIHPAKDSTLALLLAAQRRGWELRYALPGSLRVEAGQVRAELCALQVADDPESYFTLAAPVDAPLADLDLVLLRKDPPFDAEYLYLTHLLERLTAPTAGNAPRIVNHPRAVRDFNEKLAILRFPDCIPETLVSCDARRIEAFLERHDRLVLKPLDAMGGHSIFLLRRDDPNKKVILETMTGGGRYTMAQRFLPKVLDEGDRRILLLRGHPVPYALARIPTAGDFRANLAAGGRYQGVALSERERQLCQRLGPTLRQQGLDFVGLDVIDGLLSEINVTSPTCLRELDALHGLDIAGDFFQLLENATEQK